MASAPPKDLTPIINSVLNRARDEMGIGTDAALGKALGASDQAIYLWRKGEIGKSARVLIPLIMRQYEIQPPRTPIKFGRRRRKLLS